jgi:predicted HAD superfamily Cof-like phosphohydrolase
MHECLDTRDPCKKLSGKGGYYTTNTDLIASQFDALVDSWYYSLNIAAKHGVNMSKMFDIVHNANMAKRDPETGIFLRRESDGKVIKPKGWQSPNVEAEIERQMKEGSWLDAEAIPLNATENESL